MATPENTYLYYATVRSVPTDNNASTHNQVRAKGPSFTVSPTAKGKGDRNLKSSSEVPQQKTVDLQGARYWDTHTHVDQILKRHSLPLSGYDTFKATNFPPGFAGCVSVCCEIEAIEPTIELIDSQPDIVAAFGIHPHNASTYTDEVENRLISLMSHPKTVAWGEIGLDYHYDLSDRDVQRRVFERQIECAVRARKPIVVHSREAEEDTFTIMKKAMPKDWKVHVHCFTSSGELAQQLMDEFPNLYIGFTGVITFAGALKKVVNTVPVERILLETDGPYMAPIPFRYIYLSNPL
eukprot:TRINITY_DN6553_c0_g1_i1.p1 TRINITY_DN6553_c0_g1~~TRINITY_DN6553_c0_g1_i1.p1  ORF type:complete len:344 (+),score=39.96 TRINITY_DN6553_c0_g1_i1:152-1033(+)